MDAISASAAQILIFMGPGLILAYLMNSVAGMVEKKAYQVLGRKAYLWLFGWLGTAVHELGHAIMCIIFGHRIEKLVLFNPSPDSQPLGSVDHSYNPKNLYHAIGNFFIGIGPIILGTLLIYLASLVLLSKSFHHHAGNLNITYEVLLDWQSLRELGVDIYDIFTEFFTETFTGDGLTTWQFYVFCYLLFCIGSAMKLSGADIKSAIRGFLLIVGIIFIANLALIYFDYSDRFSGVTFVSAYFSAFYVAMLFTLVFNVIMLIILTAIREVKSLFS